MTVALKDTAFAKHLLSLPREEAAGHLFDCLVRGAREDNMAWELFEEAHGSEPLSDINFAISKMLDYLAGK